MAMPFEHAVRVAFDHRAVHERAGVALVGVADDVLLIGRLLQGDRPLRTGREPAASRVPAGRFVRRGCRPRRASVRGAPWPGPRSRPGRCTRRGWRGPRGRSWRGPTASAVRRTDARRGTARRPRGRGSRGTDRAAQPGTAGRRTAHRAGHRPGSRDAREAQARPARQLDVDERLLDAEADAADFHDVCARPPAAARGIASPSPSSSPRLRRGRRCRCR